MLLRPLTNGKVTGTDTVACPSTILGGVMISTDGTNAAVVAVHVTSAAGTKVFDISTKTPMFIVSPIEAAENIYYSVTGTGASAQFYGWEN
jgi:hypothetical protein